LLDGGGCGYDIIAFFGAKRGKKGEGMSKNMPSNEA
jgi:hypothetical protein